MKKFILSLCQDFTIYHDVDVLISQGTLIKLQDGSIKSAVFSAEIYFCLYPQLSIGKSCLMKSFMNGNSVFFFFTTHRYFLAVPRVCFAASVAAQSKHTNNLYPFICRQTDDDSDIK